MSEDSIAKVRQVAPGWTVQVCWGANAGWRATWERGLMAGLNLGRFAIVAYRCDLQTLMVKGVKALKAPATPQPEGT